MAGLPRPSWAIREATSGLDALGQPFDAAEMAVDALILMPADPEIRRLAEEHRSVLESVGARRGLRTPRRGPRVEAARVAGGCCRGRGGGADLRLLALGDEAAVAT